MRWKLLISTSLVAALLGAGGWLGVSYGLLAAPPRFNAPDTTLLGTLLVPLTTIICASVFIYRHTARRRKLQAGLTALLVALLTLTALAANVVWRTRRTPTGPHPTATARRNS